MKEIIFLISSGLIIYTYFGYPILLSIAGLILKKPVNKKKNCPHVSIILSIFNEDVIIEDKIKNLLELDYPEEKLEILVGSDGSTDKTIDTLQKYKNHSIRIFNFKQRQGKISVINALVKEAAGEILFFTDARQMLKKDAILELVKNFSDLKIGAVSGELIMEDRGSDPSARSINLYWQYEKWIRKHESAIGSTIGTTGAIYAMRKNLYTPPPEDTTLDDVFIPLKVVEAGYRVIFDETALALDEVAHSAGEEYSRKVRTLAGNCQMLAQFKHMLNPLRSKIAIQLFSHKLMRLIAPFLLIIIFALNLTLIDKEIYKISLTTQTIFYCFAAVGIFLKKQGRVWKIFKLPYVFCTLNISAIEGIYRFIFNKQQITWQKTKYY